MVTWPAVLWQGCDNWLEPLLWTLWSASDASQRGLGYVLSLEMMLFSSDSHPDTSTPSIYETDSRTFKTLEQTDSRNGSRPVACLECPRSGHELGLGTAHTWVPLSCLKWLFSAHFNLSRARLKLDLSKLGITFFYGLRGSERLGDSSKVTQIQSSRGNPRPDPEPLL